MRFPIISLFVLATLVSASSYGMGRGLPRIENESINDSEVVADFNLRATDGSLLKFASHITRNGQALKGLPAERNANYKLCESSGKPGDTTHFMALSEITLKLLDQRRPLTSAETALIQKTPRCEPFTTILNLLASLVSTGTSNKVQSESLKSITLKIDKKAGNSLLVNTDSGKSAAFKISSDLKALKIADLRDFTKVQILANRSGQNLGIRFTLEEIHEGNPSFSRDHERCEATHTERQCRFDHDSGKERCETITITEPGERRIRSRTEFTMYALNLEIIDASNRVVAKGKVNDGEFNTDRDTGPCEPIGGRHGDNRRDRHDDNRDRRF